MKFHNVFLKLHKSFHLCFLTVIFMTTLACPTLSLDPKFEACAPQNCGKGQYISYPFWLNHSDLAKPFCGHPNFVVTCKEQNPVLRICNEDYIVKEISYPTHSFLLANAEAYKPTTCPTPFYNISLDGTPFKYVSNHSELFFFYNCPSKPEGNEPYPLNCASNGSLHSFATFDIHQLKDMGYQFETCKSRVIQPLDITIDSNRNKNLTEKLKMGFTLNWTAQNCSNCELSGGRCGFENNDFVCFCRDKPYYKTCNDGKRNVRKKIIIGFSTGIGGIILTCIAFFLWLRLCQNKNKYTLSNSASRSISFDPSSSAKEIEKGGTYLGVHLFSYSELEDATNKFDSAKELGDGGFGIVYYGILRDGRAVAVKCLYENSYKKLEQFMNEIDILARLRHQNLVSLYGCTSPNSRELLLVYEYISNGTVADHIHGNRAKWGNLLWPIRMKIAIETASALSYLHASSIIHRDVKTANILLDQNFCVKVADLGSPVFSRMTSLMSQRRHKELQGMLIQNIMNVINLQKRVMCIALE